MRLELLGMQPLKACTPDGDNPNKFRLANPFADGFTLSKEFFPPYYNDLLYLIKARFDKELGIKPAANAEQIYLLAEMT